MDIELKIATKENFDEIYSLMDYSFPPVEHRTKQKQYELFDNEKYEVALFYADGKYAGFLAYWKLTDFVFGEHFAIKPEMRNGGVGASSLKILLEELKQPFVLEVEDIDEDLPQRRIRFYERNGFILSDVCYIQPALQPTDEEVMLKLMFNKNGKDIDLKLAKSEIFGKVYNISEGKNQ